MDTSNINMAGALTRASRLKRELEHKNQHVCAKILVFKIVRKFLLQIPNKPRSFEIKNWRFLIRFHRWKRIRSSELW